MKSKLGIPSLSTPFLEAASPNSERNLREVPNGSKRQGGRTPYLNDCRHMSYLAPCPIRSVLLRRVSARGREEVVGSDLEGSASSGPSSLSFKLSALCAHACSASARIFLNFFVPPTERAGAPPAPARSTSSIYVTVYPGHSWTRLPTALFELLIAVD